jgi:hypothetical protein
LSISIHYILEYALFVDTVSTFPLIHIRHLVCHINTYTLPFVISAVRSIKSSNHLCTFQPFQHPYNHQSSTLISHPMSFLAIPLLKLGFSQAKKQKAKRDAKKEQQKYQDAGVYPPYQPDAYPLSGYPPGAAPGTTMHFTPAQSKTTKLVSIFFSILRFLQFVFGFTVLGLYGKDVHHDHSDNHAWHSQWVYALVTGFLATVTALVHLVKPFVMRKVNANAASSPVWLLPQFAWEFVVTVLWLALFGVFGKMYIGVHPASDNDDAGASKINRMRHAVWIDVINLGFWVMTASWVLLRWLKSRRNATGDAVDAEKGDQI